MRYVHAVTRASDNATMMKLPVVAKQEMSHPIIHHFKKAKHHSAMHIKILSNFIVNYSSSKHILQRIFPKMNCSYAYLKNITKQNRITANESMHAIRTRCYQSQWQRNHDEITSSCQTRNVASHHPSFQKSKTPFSHAHQNFVKLHRELLIVQAYFTTYLLED